MGGLGADAALEAADIILMEDEPARIINAIRIAKATLRSVSQNMAVSYTHLAGRPDDRYGRALSEGRLENAERRVRGSVAEGSGKYFTDGGLRERLRVSEHFLEAAFAEGAGIYETHKNRRCSGQRALS